MQSDYKVLILENHLDTFGHVNNATYLSLFEQARWQRITERGFGLNEIIKKKMGPVILEINLKFLKEIRLRETIIITTQLVADKNLEINSSPNSPPPKIGLIKQQMIKENGDIACDALFTFGFFDLTTRKLITPPPEWIAAL